MGVFRWFTPIFILCIFKHGSRDCVYLFNAKSVLLRRIIKLK